jgi:hypothetical protein
MLTNDQDKYLTDNSVLYLPVLPGADIAERRSFSYRILFFVCRLSLGSSRGNESDDTHGNWTCDGIGRRYVL